MKRFNVDGPSKLHSAKSLEGTSLCNVYSQKRKQEYKKFSLHVIGMYYSRIWGCMLGPMQRRTDKCIRPSTNESCSIY